MALGDLSWTTIAIIGVGAAVLLIGVTWYLRRRSQRDEADQGSGTDRLEAAQEREDYSIPLRTRAAGMTIEGKAAAVGLLVAMGYVGFEAWSFFKTGSPSQITRAAEFQLALGGLISSTITLAWYRSQREGNIGRLEIEYEDPDGEPGERRTSTVFFDARDVIEEPVPTSRAGVPESEQTEQTERIVHETTQPSFFGLIQTAKRVADVRELRNDSVYRPHSDKVAHRIPKHAVQVGADEWYIRTKRRKTTNSPKNAADFEYLPPYTMSADRQARIETNNDIIRRTNRELRVNLADAEQKIRGLRDRLDAAEDDGFEQALAKMERMRSLIGPDYSQMHQHRHQERGRSSRNGDGSTNGNGHSDGQIDVEQLEEALDGLGGGR
jgi:hypothetical protein